MTAGTRTQTPLGLEHIARSLIATALVVASAWAAFNGI